MQSPLQKIRFFSWIKSPLFLLADELKLKGITIFRDGCLGGLQVLYAGCPTCETDLRYVESPQENLLQHLLVTVKQILLQEHARNCQSHGVETEFLARRLGPFLAGIAG